MNMYIGCVCVCIVSKLKYFKHILLLSHMLTVGEAPSDKDVTLNPSVGLYRELEAKLFCPASLTICETNVDLPDRSRPNTSTFFSNVSSNCNKQTLRYKYYSRVGTRIERPSWTPRTTRLGNVFETLVVGAVLSLFPCPVRGVRAHAQNQPRRDDDQCSEF